MSSAAATVSAVEEPRGEEGAPRKTDRSRDNAALGAEVLAKFGELSILIVGLKGLGVEIGMQLLC
jgi:hypothetical protein